MATTLIRGKRTDSASRAIARPLVVFISAYSLVAIALGLLVSTDVAPIDVHHGLPWPLVAVALLVVRFIPVRIHKEGHSLQLDLTGAITAVGAVFTSPHGLVFAVTAAAVVYAVIHRDQIERAVFNVANSVTGATVARLCLALVVGTGSPTGLRGLIAISLAALTFEAATDVGVLAAVTLSSGRPPGWEYTKTVIVNAGLVSGFNAILATITVTVGIVETWGILLLVGPALGLGIWYKRANAARAHYANLEKLYDFTVKLKSLSQTEDIVAAALVEARALLHGEDIELILSVGPSHLRCRGDATGRVAKIFDQPTAFEEGVVGSGKSVLVPSGQSNRLPDCYDGRFRDLMAVPVHLGDAGEAVLIVGNHESKTETFDNDDLKFLEALAANLGTALTASHRLDRLRSEVAAREHQALHDGLTGLANRTLFSQWVVKALAARRPHQQVAVILMDLDGFKDINDTLGHHTGDLILKEVSGRALAAAGANRQVARLGGDEYAIVIPGATSSEDVMAVAQELLDSVSRPMSIEGMTLELQSSLGVAIAPQHGTDSETLLRRADVAMYSAKGARRGIVSYDIEFDQNTKRRLGLATELRQAMEAGDLEVWYQPIARLDTGEVSGLEALLRWRHRIHGPISPDEFIPVAEQSRLIEPLTWWVLEQSLRELERWRRDGYQLTMAVNISTRSLLGPEIVDRLRRILADVSVPAGDLTLEITESMMMVDPDGAERILRQLADLGVKVAIDDFGTGYSSLSRLKTLPVHAIKIDRSFVFGMHHDKGDEAIVRATIDLARNMGHWVIAEGVERQDTWDLLADLGCDEVQGYLLAAAMPADECRKWLRRRQTPSLAPIRVLPRARLGA